jgi:hypothetical protein
MLLGFNSIYDQEDKSQLYKAWTKYYTDLGLSYNKITKKVLQRVRTNKMPNNH